MQLKIGDIIEVAPVQTIIRLDQAGVQAREITESFVLTSKVTNHLNVISESLMRQYGQGFFLQGDFGAGKSHFLAILASV